MSAAEVVPLVRQEVDSLEVEGLRAALEAEREAHARTLDALERVETFAAEAHLDCEDPIGQGALNYIRVLAAKARKGT